MKVGIARRAVALALLLAAAAYPAQTSPVAAAAADTGPHAPPSPFRSPNRWVDDASPSTISRWQTYTWSQWDTAHPTTFDVRVSRTPARATGRRPWQLPANLQNISATQVRLDVGLGTVLCVQVRSRDPEGRTSAWTKDHSCVTRAFGPGSLRGRGPVHVLTGKGYWRGRAKALGVGGTLTLPGVPKGSSEVVFVTYKPGDRMLLWTMPGETVSSASYHYQRVRHTVAIHWADKHSRYRGPLRFENGGHQTSLPVEGVALMPPWMFTLDH